jgi:hypothetical protein
MKKLNLLKIGLLTLALAMICGDVFAITAPATGSFAFDVYDLAVTKILKGPIGFVSGLSAIVFGAFLAIQSKILPCLLCLLAGGIIIKADTITVSLGMMI